MTRILGVNIHLGFRVEMHIADLAIPSVMVLTIIVVMLTIIVVMLTIIVMMLAMVI